MQTGTENNHQDIRKSFLKTVLLLFECIHEKFLLDIKRQQSQEIILQLEHKLKSPIEKLYHRLVNAQPQKFFRFRPEPKTTLKADLNQAYHRFISKLSPTIKHNIESAYKGLLKVYERLKHIQVIELKRKTKTVFKELYNRLISIEGHPREIALGFALGIFVGMTPTMGFQMPIAAFFASIIGWNIISATVAVWITNPVTAPFIYGINYLVGAKLLGIKISHISKNIYTLPFHKILTKTPDIIWAMTVGGVILSIPLVIIAYYFVYSIARKSQEEIKQKRALRRERQAIKSEKE